MTDEKRSGPETGATRMFGSDLQLGRERIFWPVPPSFATRRYRDGRGRTEEAPCRSAKRCSGENWCGPRQ
jgi:hypothetical protein